METDRRYFLFFALLVIGLPAVTAFPSIDITGMFAQSPSMSPESDEPPISAREQEFVDRMYGSGKSVSLAESNVEVKKRNNRTYAYPKGVNVSKFDEKIFETDLLKEELYSDMDSFNVILGLEKDIGSGSEDELPSEIRELEEARFVEIKNVLKSSDSVALKIRSDPGEVFRRLNSIESVARGTLDSKMEVLNLDANTAVGAGAARQTFNINGSGEKLAVLDTGVEPSHIDYSSRLVIQKDYSGDGTGDVDGHGTHVSGTVLGDGSAEGGYHPGISQNGSLISVKVLGDDGSGFSSDIQTGIEYAADKNASVISMSLGGSNFQSTISNYNDSVQYARTRGSVVVAAAGNDGGYEDINAPGSVPDIITVGAVDDSENLAYFSSKGPEDVYYNIKPEVMAPGYDLVSASNDYPSTNYTTKRGTSMSTPVVSGVIGLVREQNPGWTVEEVENAVIASGEGNQIGDGKNVFERGTGIINVSKAVDPELKLSETRLNLGNISAKEKHGTKITLENPTGQQKNYTTSSEIHRYNRSSGNVETGQASISFNQSSVVVPAGGSRDIKVFLEIEEEYSEIYGGLARFEADESYGMLVGGYTNNVSQLSADISLNSTTIDVNDSVEANGSDSVDPEGSIQSYSWDMGDGTSLSGEAVEHSYSSLGDYTVNLTVEDGDTNQASDSKMVTVKDLTNPQAAFTVNDSSPEASIDTVSFNSSQSSDNLEISHYLWDFDEDDSYEKNISSEQVDKSYSTVGTRTVELKVVDASGNSDTTTMDVDVEDTTPPSVSLSLNATNVTVDEDFEMDGSGSSDNTGINSYSWSYGSKNAASSTVVDSLGSPGLYTVELNVSDSYGNENSTTEELEVSDVTDPNASITIETQVTELGQQVNFSGSQSADNVQVSVYSWDLNNDSSFEGSGVNYSKTVSSPGNYSIGLEIEDTSNNTDFESTWFYVNDTESPQIDLAIDSDFPETGEQITLNASNTTDNDFVKTYDWDLSTTTVEDGSASINHTYSSEGNYTVELNATDNSSNQASRTQQIEVKDFSIDIDDPSGNTSGEKQWINVSFTRNVSEINSTLNSSQITLNEQNSTFYSNELDLNESDYELYVEAKDTYSHYQNKSLNFTNTISPQINLYELSERLVGLNDSMVFTANLSEDNYDNVEVDIKRPNGSYKSLSLNNQSRKTDENVIWNKTFTPSSRGNYSAFLNVTDSFGEQKTMNKTFEVAEKREFNLTLESGRQNEFSIKDRYGSQRYNRTGSNISSSLPEDTEWEAVFSDTDSDSRIKLRGLNITRNVSANFSFDPSLIASPGIERFQESSTFAASIPLNYSNAEIRVNHSGDVEEGYRCSNWSFDSDGCDSGWTDVSSNLTSNSTHAKLNISGLSAYAFGYTEEEEQDEEDETDDSQDSGGSGGSAGGGSAGALGGSSSEPDVRIVENNQSIVISRIYEGHIIEFNTTELPITAIEFESNADNGTIEIEAVEPGEELSFTSVLKASSDISGPYTLQFEVSSDWLEENRFDASEVSLFSLENGEWIDQQASLLDELPEKSIYEAEVQNLSRIGIGLNIACYSTENVTAETESSCRTYSNPCRVPEEAEMVESCQSFEEEEQVRQQIEQKRQEVRDEEKIAKLNQAETLVEQGDVSQAREIVRSVSADRGLEIPSNAIIGFIASIIIIGGGLTSYIFISRRRTHRMVVEMGELIDMLKELDRRGIDVKAPAMKLQKANSALKNGNYHKAAELTSEVKEYLQRDLDRRNQF